MIEKIPFATHLNEGIYGVFSTLELKEWSGKNMISLRHRQCIVNFTRILRNSFHFENFRSFRETEQLMFLEFFLVFWCVIIWTKLVWTFWIGSILCIFQLFSVKFVNFSTFPQFSGCFQFSEKISDFFPFFHFDFFFHLKERRNNKFPKKGLKKLVQLLFQPIMNNNTVKKTNDDKLLANWVVKYSNVDRL